MAINAENYFDRTNIPFMWGMRTRVWNECEMSMENDRPWLKKLAYFIIIIIILLINGDSIMYVPHQGFYNLNLSHLRKEKKISINIQPLQNV